MIPSPISMKIFKSGFWAKWKLYGGSERSELHFYGFPHMASSRRPNVRHPNSKFEDSHLRLYVIVETIHS